MAFLELEKGSDALLAVGVQHPQARFGACSHGDVGFRPFGPPAANDVLRRTGPVKAVGQQGVLGRAPAFPLAAGTAAVPHRMNGQDLPAAMGVLQGRLQERVPFVVLVCFHFCSPRIDFVPCLLLVLTLTAARAT